MHLSLDEMPAADVTRVGTPPLLRQGNRAQVEASASVCKEGAENCRARRDHPARLCGALRRLPTARSVHAPRRGQNRRYRQGTCNPSLIFGCSLTRCAHRSRRSSRATWTRPPRALRTCRSPPKVEEMCTTCCRRSRPHPSPHCNDNCNARLLTPKRRCSMSL